MKIQVLFALLLGLVAVGSVDAAVVRGAKPTSTTMGTGVVNISSGPAVLYSVILGTGAVTDFVTLFDSATVVGITPGLQAQAAFKMRLYATSATANTIVNFDPPLQFNEGLVYSNSTGVMSTMVTYEPGRIGDQ